MADGKKKAAQLAVVRAVRAGRLVRQPCEICGTTVRVQGHHKDYSKQLEVQWLCPLHHKAAHYDAGRVPTGEMDLFAEIMAAVSLFGEEGCQAGDVRGLVAAPSIEHWLGRAVSFGLLRVDELSFPRRYYSEMWD